MCYHFGIPLPVVLCGLQSKAMCCKHAFAYISIAFGCRTFGGTPKLAVFDSF